MKKFDVPEINVEVMDIEDIITTSNGGNGGNANEGGDTPTIWG